ncbi:neprilysin-1-like [Dermacentor variabilis]|uniref:neprilysin-1-like n=1 Tax=Dermacentor variabilis TaxID=34621 RepID=UPI003F5B0275
MGAPVCRRVVPVPSALNVTYSSPSGSWVSYSLPTCYEPPPPPPPPSKPPPPPAPPSNTNVQSTVSFSSMQDKQPPLQPSSSSLDMLCRMSSYQEDKSRGTAQQPVTATTTRTVATEVEFRFAQPTTDRRSVGVMTSSVPCEDDRRTGGTHYETAPSDEAIITDHEQNELSGPESALEVKDGASLGDQTSSEHGWYQPLHIVPKDSYGTKDAALKFFDFAWGAPRRGPARNTCAARTIRATADEDDRLEVNPFSWSSKELLIKHEPTTTQQFKSALEIGMEDETHSDVSTPQWESPKEAESDGVVSSSKPDSPAALSTNLLRSATSEDELAGRESELADEDKFGSANFDAEEEEETEEVKHEDKEEEKEAEEQEGGGSHGDEEVPKFSGKKPAEENESVDNTGSEASIEHAEQERNPETVVSPPKNEPSPSKLEPETMVAASAVSLAPPAELTKELEEAADKASEEMDKDLRDLELTSVQLYPESRLVILLAILCLIWIIFLVLSAAVKHGRLPPTCDESTIHTVAPTTRDQWPPVWPPITYSTQKPKQPLTNSTATTQEPLRGNFICSSDYCRREGNYLRALTSRSTKEPCENFYEHVCGTWKKSASRMIQKFAGAAVSTDTLLQASMEAQLLAYIKDRTHADVTPARALYDMCMNRGSANAALLDTKQLLHQWGSDWPQKESANSSTKEVWRFAAKLMRVLGVPSLVGIEIGLDPWNLEENIIEVGPPRTVFFSKDVSEPRVMTLFGDATRAAAKALNPNDADAADAAAKDVSIALASISLRQLDDLGTSPLDFQVDKLSSLGKGVQYFLRTVVDNVATLDSRTRLLVHRSPLFRRELDETVNRLPPRAMLNYLGLLALVALSPFLPERLSSLRVLHSVHTLGRAENGSNELLCLRAVSQAYPACLAAASHTLYKNTHRSLWLSQLESLFVGYVRNVVWMDNLTSLFVRYKMQHHRLARFFPVWPLGDCNATTGAASSKTIGAFVGAVSLRQTQELQQLAQSPLQPSTGSPLSVWPRYRLCLRLFQIPVGLVNDSVPANGTFFALHLSRVAVRLYAALAQLLYEGTVYEREIPLYFTEEAERTLEDLFDCLLGGARHAFPHGLRAERVRNALLEQVLALQLGFLAFRRLLAVRRIWGLDFRLSTLPEVSSDQLFFLYYALDHCELSDAVFESHQFEAYRRLPSAVRVNMAVRQSTRFAQAFRCPPGSPMVAGEPCQVLR